MLILHASINFYTFGQTYDGFVHIFFADHYVENWFDNWDYRWYTGFNITSYPPLVHQTVALLSMLVGLKIAFVLWSMLIMLWLVRGMYNFAQLWVNKEAAGIASILVVFTGSVTEALHIFGQVPCITGLAFLLNACPEVYKWLITNKRTHLFLGLSFIAVTTAAHHVTTIFGTVFFIFPIISIAMIDLCAKEQGGIKNVNLWHFVQKVLQNLKRLIGFGVVVGFLALFIIFPYWSWTFSDPINQVPIPHGSRSSFIEEPNLGIVFFLFPWGIMLFALPYIFYRVFARRNIGIGISLTLLFILGTGGTTFLPKMILGETAFEILTLDRFTFWATISAVPFFAELILLIYKGNLRRFSFNAYVKKPVLVFFTVGLIIFNLIIVNASFFQSFQPDKIDPIPIANFLKRDQHSNWRFLTLGFGDQMAWLSTHTDALSVDGNYHSARRLPEMTSKAVERLENAKYQGDQGISSLTEFLTIPEKFSLKYIFANDKFYAPILYYSGWHKVQQLENDIVVWEKPDIPPLPQVLPRKNIPPIQIFLWGTLPLFSLFLAMLLFVVQLKTGNWKSANDNFIELTDMAIFEVKKKSVWLTQFTWMAFLLLFIAALISFNVMNSEDQRTPEDALNAYYHAIDFKKFDQAYHYLDEELRPSMEQFLLNISLEDGIHSSYAILDTLNILNLDYYEPGKANATIELCYTTSLESYFNEVQIGLTQSDGRWWIVPREFEKTVPPDQFFHVPEVSYLKQGRRKADVKMTRREDILDRPEAYLLQSSLVEKEGQHYIVGEIQNIDNVPIYVTIEGNLYDKKGIKIARYNAANVVNHRLLPKEKTPFRIDFNSKIDEPYTGNQGPEQYKNEYHEIPVNFDVVARTMVISQSLYKPIGAKDIEIHGTELNGSVINLGTKEISIPQILLAEYDEKKRLNWVESYYLEQGIRPQREIDFEIPFSIDDVKIIKRGRGSNLIVNGTSRYRINYYEDINAHIKDKKTLFIDKPNSTSFKIYLNGFVYDLK